MTTMRTTSTFSVLIRYADTSPNSADCIAAFSFNRRVELDASYRLNEGLGGLFILMPIIH